MVSFSEYSFSIVGKNAVEENKKHLTLGQLMFELLT